MCNSKLFLFFWKKKKRKKNLNFTPTLKDSFAKFTILGWQLFSLRALKVFSVFWLSQMLWRGVLMSNYLFFVFSTQLILRSLSLVLVQFIKL